MLEVALPGPTLTLQVEGIMADALIGGGMVANTAPSWNKSTRRLAAGQEE
jgi:hypothetical protein